MGKRRQCEIGTKFGTLTQRADWTQVQTVDRGTWRTNSKTATFMPAHRGRQFRHARSPIDLERWQNLFAGDGYAGLSDWPLYYIGGIIKHARAPMPSPTRAPTATSLVPGYEGSGKLACSARNRSASIRIPTPPAKVVVSRRASRIPGNLPVLFGTDEWPAWMVSEQSPPGDPAV